MRVALNGLFLAHPATGTGQYLREIARALCVISPQDEFVFLSPRADPTAPAAIQVHPTRLNGDNLAKLEFEHVTFPRSARSRFEVAHVPHFGPPLFPAQPTVVTIHDLIPLVVPAYRGSLAVRLYSRLAAMGAKRAQAILADSHASARDIESLLKIPRERIHVVHLAADPRYQPPGRQEIERVRAKYGLPEYFVLYLGGFDVRKNVARVVETFARLERRDWRLEIGDWRNETGDGRLETDYRSPITDNLQLVLAGKLPERDSAFFPDPRRMVEKFGVAGRTQCIGFVAEEDKPALYAAAEVFMYPSFYEGFGLPPLEAMASGTPVIVSNSSSLPEVVGDAGIALPPDDADGWAEALRNLLEDHERRAELRTRGLEQAKRFSWERAARETLAVYRSVIGR